MKYFYLTALTLFIVAKSVNAQNTQVAIQQDDSGMRLQVNGKDFMVNGMNWDYFPIGTNFNYSLWRQPDDIIMAALDAEMSLLKNMGVNSVRIYTGIPAKWITYIYERYGIYTMLNHSFGRYGLTLEGGWMANTEYSDPRVRALLLKEVTEMVRQYRGTPGLLLYLLGNENNYGLFWGGAETEDIPVEDRESTIRATAMYKLFNEATLAMKAIDTSVPIAICNGDLLFLEIIKEECKDIDIFGTNMYRGASFGDAFDRVMNELNKPILFTEFGADAFNAIDNAEDQQSQAYYMVNNWQEIYENAAGLGKAGNSLGGYTFQFSDGWWKTGQTVDLEIHNTEASWANGGYERDFIEGENNMNEEWFGVAAKGQTTPRGLYTLYPRAAYYALQEAHQFDPYNSAATLGSVQNHFATIDLTEAMLKARSDKAALQGEQSGILSISELRAQFTTFNTGGNLTTTPENPDPDQVTFPNQQGFDQLQSFFVGVEANPSSNVRANVSFNILGNVALNPIDEIFYENRGRPVTIQTQNGTQVADALGRVAVYQAEYTWNHKFFDLKGFYRTGHYHWGYEGDFFGLYPEANYGPNIDIYNALAPSGFEINGKKLLKNFKLAFGRELWWGANPAVLVKYRNQMGKTTFTGIFHEDLDDPGVAVSSIAIPQPRTRRLTFQTETELSENLKFEIGGIWAGQPLIDREFQIVRGTEGNYETFTDRIRASDLWGGKAKITFSKGRINWYAQAASQGLVANGGGDYTRTFTGWTLKDNGSGNKNNVLSGFTYTVGNLQIAPNFMWQKPLVDPIPTNMGGPARPRNILEDPFVVRFNRETVGGELLLTFDPTPGTWMYDWDNDMQEDAPLAASLGFVYRHLPTTMDAAIIFPGTGRVPVAADGAPPALDLWEINTRIVSKINSRFGIIANVYGGNGQANGPDPRTIQRYGGDVRMIYKDIKISSFLKFNDWGPFDFHRDFNLTFPIQIMTDISTSVGKQEWYMLPNTTMGVRFTWRSLDQFSPRYNPAQTVDISGNIIPDPTAVGFPNGNEWELRTYVHIHIGK
ncbi:Glycosyl hydrolases family 2, TIM barrel domain [Algoriphagus faecimaris]|uniref:Glycosyl hydrolases family 2, TIM barrel domain n=1 Tax=Algoriphagus faecimaris TaxID=686796 RepID=A0A1G6PNT9_9BACT|nr:glycoside hydrolase family 2 TIM barrel-domain containing protein [Algoriphagus faecimaris]SDC81015.1 Glycosyl hydrolases family 2, TIM barrel domain [Algoriphagus faecimaris]